MTLQSLDMDYFKQIAERRNKRIESERAEALRKKNEPKPEVQEEQEEKTIRMPESAEPKKDYVFVPSLGLYLSENRYLQNKNWNETQDILHKEGIRMPTILEFIELLKYLRSGEGKSKVKNADKILDEIYTPRNPYRAEWLDAKFENGKISYHVFDTKRNIIQKQEEIESYKTPRIDLNSWLDNSTKQSLSYRKDWMMIGDVSCWSPSDGGVAWFYANSECANLGIFKPTAADEDDIVATIGVRLANAQQDTSVSRNGGKTQ